MIRVGGGINIGFDFRYVQFLSVCSLAFIVMLAGCVTLLMSLSRNDVEFVKGELEERYKCIACRLVLQNPMQSSCGHR